jgi:hypothetical protein
VFSQLRKHENTGNGVSHNILYNLSTRTHGSDHARCEIYNYGRGPGSGNPIHDPFTLDPESELFEVGVVESRLRTDTQSALLTIRKPAARFATTSIAVLD